MASTYTAFTIGSTGGVAVKLTREQLAEQRAWLRESKKQAIAYRKAERKAKALLRNLLGRAQWQLYKTLGYLEVVGQSAKRYRLQLGQRIKVMAQGEDVDYELCLVTTGEKSVPPTDTLITRLMLLLSGEAGEKIVHEKSNRSAPIRYTEPVGIAV